MRARVVGIIKSDAGQQVQHAGAYISVFFGKQRDQLSDERAIGIDCCFDFAEFFCMSQCFNVGFHRSYYSCNTIHLDGYKVDKRSVR